MYKRQVCTAEGLLRIKDDPNSPVALKLTLKSAGVKDGVQLHAEIENKSAAPYKLLVCPGGHLCCVEGLHPLVAYDNTGMGLCDFCKTKPHCAQEKTLASKASYPLDIAIPTNRLPEKCRKPGKTFSVLLCFELGENKLVHSNTIEVELK